MASDNKAFGINNSGQSMIYALFPDCCLTPIDCVPGPDDVPHLN
jgi:hypothetical protein